MNRIVASYAVRTLIALTVSAPVNAANTVTVGSLSNPGGLMAALEAAHAVGATTISITPGYYNLPVPTVPASTSAVAGGMQRPFKPATATVLLNGWKDTTISCYGCTFMINDTSTYDYFVNLSNCTSVTWQGGTITTCQLPVCESPIVSVGLPDSKGYLTYNVTTLAGYPPISTGASTGTIAVGLATIVDSVTHLFKPNTGDFYAATATYIGMDAGGHRQFNVDLNAPCGAALAKGDIIATQAPTGPCKMYIINCTSCTIKDVTMYRGGAWDLTDISSSATTFDHDIHRTGPPPDGGTVSPLFSGFGAMSVYDSIGPTVKNCEWYGLTQDDIIAIGGRAYKVLNVVGNVLNVRNSGPYPKVGDTLRVSNKSFYCEVTITAISQSADGATSTITLDKDYNIPADCWATDPAYCGRGFKFLNCKFGSTRTRHIVAAADDGLIEGNTFFNAELDSIRIANEFGHGSEFAHNVVIRNNVVNGNGRSYHGTGAAIQIGSFGPQGNANITVENNTIIGATAESVAVAGSNGVRVANNTFANTAMYSPTNSYKVVGIWTSSNVALSGNILKNPGPKTASPWYFVDPTSKNVTGLDSSGLKVQHDKN